MKEQRKIQNVNWTISNNSGSQTKHSFIQPEVSIKDKSTFKIMRYQKLVFKPKLQIN
jgi:hypothetical protein